MKEAKEYPVTFPFGATSWPYSALRRHLGEDRKMPLRTPVKVNGVLIGYAGTTGKSSGVHTHTQKVADGVVKHPNGGGFTVPSPVTVTETGRKADIGNYVRYRDANGVIWSIFHFDEVVVKTGQLKEEEMVTITGLNVIYRYLLGVGVTDYGRKNYLGKVTWDEAYRSVIASDTYKALVKQFGKDKKVDLNRLPKDFRKIISV